MSTFTFRPAVRGHTPLIIGIGGPTKSGKTYSAHRLARGLAGGKPVAMLNAEGPRGHQYAEIFDYLAADLDPPFRPTRYTEAVRQMKEMDLGCAIIDSASHMHDGPGGILEWHEEILDRTAGSNYKEREKRTFTAWVEPKAAENQFIYALLELRCPVILCFRAKEKLKIVPGKQPIDLGWQPIVGERVAFETIFTLMLPPHSKGVPDLAISEMREPFDTMMEPGKQIDEDLGERLAAWARGGGQESGSPPRRATRSPSTRPESRQPSEERSGFLEAIGVALLQMVPMDKQGEAAEAEVFRLRQKYLKSRDWDAIKGFPAPVLEMALKAIRADLAKMTLPKDVPDGVVPEAAPESEAAWAALEERSRAIGWTGLQWQGAREHLGYADVLAEIMALEPDPTQRALGV